MEPTQLPPDPLNPVMPPMTPAEPQMPATPPVPSAEPFAPPVAPPAMPEPLATPPSMPEPMPAAAAPAPPATAAPDPAPVQPAEQPAAAPVAGSHPKRILLVEDDDALANVYVTRLQAEGFDVRRVANGEDALASALSYHPDLVLLDVMMPKVSGFDVLDILRNTPETANLKIIMLTALSQDSDKERAESLGVDDYLVKSQVVIADVIDRIRHHLGP